MKKTKNNSVYFLMSFLILAVSLLNVSGVMGADAIVLNYSQFVGAQHPLTQDCIAWAGEIEKRTGGRVTIKNFPGSTLTKPQECYDAVTKGICDIGMSVFAYTRTRFPVMTTLDLPLGYCSGMAASEVANSFYQQMKPKELNDTKILYVFAHGPGLLHTNKKPVKTLADIKGMKIRSTGASAKIVKALGGVPVAMPQTETYQALKKGIVAGTLTPMETLMSMNQARVIKYTTDCYPIGYTTSFFVAMNLKKWNALPEDIKKIFEKVSEEWVAVHGRTWTDSDLEGRSMTLQLGNSIIPLSKEESAKWKQAVEPVIENYAKALDDKGLPGTEGVNKIKDLLKEYSAKYCK
jgi:TRAP-type transport system periplasmic protein